MRYDKRVILITEKEIDDLLEPRMVEVESAPVPCFEGGLTAPEQMAIFGKIRLDSFKLYLQGTSYEDVKSIVYNGQKRKIAGKKIHRKDTVLYL